MARPKGSPTINKAAPPRGRPKGSLDKAARTLIGNEMASNILQVFQAMGGTMAMLKWAEDNKTIFYTQILSRLMPAPMKPDGDDALPLFNFNFGDDAKSLEAGRRIAFALAKAAHLQGEAVAPAHEVPYSQLAEQPLPSRPSWMPTEDDDDGSPT